MRNIPTITKNLLIINILAFLAMYVLKGAMGVDLNNLLGLHFFMASDFQVYQLVTYMFMHANFEHILFNMFALWMFGCVVENVWGPKKFLFYYIFCGVGAGMLQEIAQFFSVYLEFNAQQPMGVFEALGWMSKLSHQLNGLTTEELLEPFILYCWLLVCFSLKSVYSFFHCLFLSKQNGL